MAKHTGSKVLEMLIPFYLVISKNLIPAASFYILIAFSCANEHLNLLVRILNFVETQIFSHSNHLLKMWCERVKRKKKKYYLNNSHKIGQEKVINL